MMKRLLRALAHLDGDERGAVTVEYLQILLLVVIGAVVAMAPLGAYLMRYYDNVEFVTGLPFP